jgi:hypothetical protein
MAAAKGNKNAIGNSGGKAWDKTNREKSAIIKGLALDEMRDVFDSKDEKKKWELLLKIAPHCFPQEHTGENGDPIVVKIIKSYGTNAPLEFPTQAVSEIPVGQSAEVQNSGMEPASRQEQDGIKSTDSQA